MSSRHRDSSLDCPTWSAHGCYSPGTLGHSFIKDTHLGFLSKYAASGAQGQPTAVGTPAPSCTEPWPSAPAFMETTVPAFCPPQMCFHLPPSPGLEVTASCVTFLYSTQCHTQFANETE